LIRVCLEMEKTQSLNTGLGMFCFHLGQALLKQENSDLAYSFFLPENRNGLFGINQQYWIQHAWHKLKIPTKMASDVWHCMHQDSAYFPTKRTPIVLTVHDLNFLSRYSGIRLQYRKDKMARMLDRSSAIVCISRQTGKDLEENYGLKPEDYQVIYNGNALQNFAGNVRAKSQKQRPFLLNIGVLSPRKNAHVLCGMMAFLPDLDLVIAGPTHSSYTSKILEEARKWKVQERVILAGEVSEEEKYRLYQNMEGLVFPSLAEGFGLPVVEAMSLGKSVFLSRMGSLPEIGGELAHYFPNFEPEEMAGILSRGLKNDKLNSEIKEQLITRSDLFTWDNAARGYADIYRSLGKI